MDMDELKNLGHRHGRDTDKVTNRTLPEWNEIPRWVRVIIILFIIQSIVTTLVVVATILFDGWMISSV